MKVVLAGVAFAALIASPLFAQAQSIETPLRSGIYWEQKKQSRVGDQGPDRYARKFNQPASIPDPMKPGLCSTTPGFCPDYHGSNGS
jgi:hypothetical protein